MLIAWMLLCGLSAIRGLGSEGEPTTQSTNMPNGNAFAIAAGGVVGVGIAWYVGITAEEVPDLEAHQFALPLAIAFVLGWFSLTRGIATQVNFRRVGLIAACTGMVHLCFSGGLTIPGVAITLLAFLTIAFQTPEHETDGHKVKVTKGLALVTTVGVCALVSMWLFSIAPVRRSMSDLARANDLMRRGRVVSASQLLRTALEQDSLALDPAIWLASIENRRWIANFVRSKSTSRSKELVDAFETATARAGNDPTLLKAIGEMHLQRYQVGGRPDDLGDAAKTFDQVMTLSPTQESYLAQAAEIAWEQASLNERPFQSPEDLTRTARELSLSGGVVTRILELQMILPAKKLGLRAVENPVLETAAKLLNARESAK